MDMKYANHIGYSDVNPYEIIAGTPFGKTLTVREMKCEVVKVPSYELGGFCAHFENHEQEWKIDSNPEGSVIKIRLHKDGFYYCRNGRKFMIESKPIKFYDYNF